MVSDGRGGEKGMDAMDRSPTDCGKVRSVNGLSGSMTEVIHVNLEQRRGGICAASARHVRNGEEILDRVSR